ncbi:MAG: hypothetical protein ACT4P5_13655 [Armatimonadota bacterium]
MIEERPRTMREIAEAWFPGLDQFNLILGLSEVIGHLDLLDDEGRLVIEGGRSVVNYSLAASPGGAPPGRS